MARIFLSFSSFPFRRENGKPDQTSRSLPGAGAWRNNHPHDHLHQMTDRRPVVVRGRLCWEIRAFPGYVARGMS